VEVAEEGGPSLLVAEQQHTEIAFVLLEAGTTAVAAPLLVAAASLVASDART